jgi:hypothetical protein
LFLTAGRGTVSVLKKEEKQSHQIRQGDIMKIDAGSVVYVINSDSREKLIIAKLVNPISTPGKFEVDENFRHIHGLITFIDRSSLNFNSPKFISFETECYILNFLTRN